MRTQHRKLLPVSHIPEIDLAAERTEGQGATVGRECHGIVVTIDFTERGSSRAGGRIPEYGPRQGPERGEDAAIGREGEGTDRIPFLARLRPQDPLCSQGGDMPEPY